MYFVKGDSKLDEFAEHTDNVSNFNKAHLPPPSM